jgi:acyl-CoA synthetase (AMP-forming)/AMP-acid ligase II
VSCILFVVEGGEWISTIEIENLVMGHPSVQEAAVVAIPNKKWDERPLLVVVLKPHVEKEVNHEAIKVELYKFLDGKIAKFAMPDDVVFVQEIPHVSFLSARSLPGRCLIRSLGLALKLVLEIQTSIGNHLFSTPGSSTQNATGKVSKLTLREMFKTYVPANPRM